MCVCVCVCVGGGEEEVKVSHLLWDKNDSNYIENSDEGNLVKNIIEC